MRTKLIISLLLFAGILIFLNWSAGRYLASVVTDQFDRIARTNDQMDYSYDRISVNPALGSLTVRALSFSQNGHTMEVNQITGSLTHADLWRVVRKGSRNPLAHIHSFRIRAEHLVIHDKPLIINLLPRDDHNTFREFIGESVSVRRALFSYNGRMDELMTLTDSGKPPDHNHRISISLDGITRHGDTPETPSTTPLLPNYPLPEQLRNVALQIRYNADHKTAILNALRIETPDLYIRTDGDFHYDEPGWPRSPASWRMSYILQAGTREMSPLSLPRGLGSFHLDTLSVTGHLISKKQKTDHPVLLLPGETSVYLGALRWNPPDPLVQQYSMLLGMLGLPDMELPVRSLQGRWRSENDTLRISDTVIATEPFDAELNSVLVLVPGEPADVLQGSLTFHRTSAAFNDFVDGVEGLFRIRFPRVNGRIHIDFHGDPRSLTFPFLEDITGQP